MKIYAHCNGSLSFSLSVNELPNLRVSSVFTSELYIFAAPLVKSKICVVDSVVVGAQNELWAIVTPKLETTLK